LIQVAKERGKREAQKDLKSFKTEFQKVIALNNNLQAQIEAMSSNRIMRGSNPSTFRLESEGSLTPLSQYSGKPPSYELFKTANPQNITEPMKENLNMYMTANLNANSNRSCKTKGISDFLSFPTPPFVVSEEAASENLMLSPMANESFSASSNNEIENIIISNNQSKVTKDTTKILKTGTDISYLHSLTLMI
jgi:hypothetical protein